MNRKKRRRFASGGGTGYAPDSQFQVSKSPLTKEQYEKYGYGAEHNFFPDRKLPEVTLLPRVETPTIPTAQNPESSWADYIAPLGLAGMVGKDLWDWYKNYNGNSLAGLDLSNLDLDFDDVDIQPTLDRNQQDFDNLEMPTAEFDPTLWERAGQAGGGALDMYLGSQQGGVGGAGSMVSGGADIYEALGGSENLAGNMGNVGSILSGVGDGTVEGYLQAGGSAAELANAMGYSGPVFDAAGNLLPVVGQLFSAYQGIKQGNPAGYAQAAGSLYGAASTAGLTSSTGALASSGLGAAAPLAAAGFFVADLANMALGTGSEVPYWNAAEDYIDANKDALGLDFKSKGRGGNFYVLPNGREVKWGNSFSGGTFLRDSILQGQGAQAIEFLQNAQYRKNGELVSPLPDWYQPIKIKKAQGGLVNPEVDMNSRQGGLSQAMPTAQNNPRSYYRYGAPSNPPAGPPQGMPQQMPQPMPPMMRAMGGLTMGYNQGGPPGTPRLVRGPGTGRSDDIPAQLSDGEYVFDAETVALLGDGSTDEGARRLDALRKKLRMQKGKQLSKGKFSSAAKLPEQYLE